MAGLRGYRSTAQHSTAVAVCSAAGVVPLLESAVKTERRAAQGTWPAELGCGSTNVGTAAARHTALAAQHSTAAGYMQPLVWSCCCQLWRLAAVSAAIRLDWVEIDWASGI